MKKILSITEECRGLQPSIDACDLIMRDKAESHYFHHSENINIVPQCFNYAKHVFPMSSLVHNLKANQVANVPSVATNVSAATRATFLKQREAGAGVGVCDARTSALLDSLHEKSKEAAMFATSIPFIGCWNDASSSGKLRLYQVRR